LKQPGNILRLSCRTSRNRKKLFYSWCIRFLEHWRHGQRGYTPAVRSCFSSTYTSTML